MNVFCCYIVITNVEEGWKIETLLSLIDPGRATISIVPSLPLQDVECRTFMSRKRSRCWSRHGSGGSGGGPFYPSVPRGVTASYWLTNIENSIPLRRWVLLCSRLNNDLVVCLCLNILLSFQFIFYIFYNDF